MPNKGQLLIAEMALTGDFSFSRSVIYLTENNSEGTVGFILNKKTDLNLSDLLPEVQNDFPVYNGGPVDKDHLYYIHKLPDLLPESVPIAEGVFWSGDFNILYEALKNGEIPSDKIKFFLGYSGWVPYQLESEIDGNSWIVSEKQFDIFSEKDSSIWQKEIKKLGGDYLIWANSPENPTYN